MPWLKIFGPHLEEVPYGPYDMELGFFFAILADFVTRLLAHMKNFLMNFEAGSVKIIGRGFLQG